MPLHTRSAVRDATRSALAHRATTIIIALVTIAMTMITFLTAGRAAATEAEIVAQVDSAGPRLITVTVIEPSPGLSADALARLQSLDDTEWVLALGEARDVRSVTTGTRPNIAARTFFTPLPDLVSLAQGQVPRAGEALVGPRTQMALQMVYPSGPVNDAGTIRASVGQFSAGGVISTLDRLVLVSPDPGEPVLATLIYVLAKDADGVQDLTEQIKAVSGVGTEHLVLETATELIELGEVIAGTIGALSRQLAIGAILVGMLLVSLTTALALNNRKRDFGRRRALGASRSALIVLTLVETAIPVVGGTIIGALLGVFLVRLTMGNIPPVNFVLSAVTLIALAGVMSAVPAAAISAVRDPLRILRVP